MQAGVKVEGLNEVARALRRAGVEANDLKTAFHHIGETVKTSIQTFTPHMTGVLSGSEKASRRQNQAIVTAGGGKVLYAGVQNFGGYHNIEAKHFMERGLAAKEDWIVSEIENELNKIINKLGLT
jgi:phage gpG-like protein